MTRIRSLLVLLALTLISAPLLPAEEPAPRDEMPVAIERVAPVYPLELRRKKIKGEVVVEFIIDREGAVRNPRTVESPHPLMSEAAEAALLKWKFKPGRKEGVAVNTRVRQSLTFSLEEKPEEPQEPAADARPKRSGRPGS